MQRTRTPRLLLVALLAAVLAGCTTGPPADPSPTASPTAGTTTPPSPSPAAPGRVAVVVSPDAVLPAGTELDSRTVGAGILDVPEVRVVTADDRSFLVDLAAFFATEGYELVCVVGAGAEEAVREVAPEAPSTRFCAAPARADDMPPNVLPINLRVEEVGYLAGIALAADGAVAGDGASAGTAGLVRSAATWQPQRLRLGLEAGLAAAGVPGVAVRVTGAVDEEAVVDEVTALLEAGTGGILSVTGDLDAVVRDVVAEVPVTPPAPPSPSPEDASPDAPSPSPSPTDRFAGLVAGPAARPGDDDTATEDDVAATPLLAVVELHIEEAIALAIERHLGDWDTTPASVGMAEGALRVEVAAGPRGAVVAGPVRQAVEGLQSGDLQVEVG